MKVSIGTQQVEVPGADPAPDQARLAQAAQQFEAVLLRRMLSSLEKTTQMQSGKGTSMYGGMIVDAMADAIVGSGGLGMARLIEESLPGKKTNDSG